MFRSIFLVWPVGVECHPKRLGGIVKEIPVIFRKKLSSAAQGNHEKSQVQKQFMP